MPTFAALAIFVVLLVGAQLYFGNFITPRNMSALLLDNAFLLILAVGMTFVILTGGIDLSVGSVMALTGILCAKLLGRRRAGRRWSCRSSILVGAAMGLRHRHPRPVLRRPAVHRLARRTLPRPRPGVRREPQVDPGRATPASCGCSPPASSIGDWYITPDRHHRAARRARSARSSCSHRDSGAPSTPSAATSSPPG